jgi:lysophospholipase L1-like esterase
MRIVLALCVFALFLSAAAGGSVADKYAAAAKAKWDGAIKKFEMLDKRSDYAADSILFIGSSSIRLWETLGRDMAPYPVINPQGKPKTGLFRGDQLHLNAEGYALWTKIVRGKIDAILGGGD